MRSLLALFSFGFLAMNSSPASSAEAPRPAPAPSPSAAARTESLVLGGGCFWCVEAAYELVPGVRAVATPGHTVAHMSLYVEPERGKPIVLCGDAADLTENLEHELAPGLCYREREGQAVESIQKLKRLARETGAELWPNHDMAFYRRLPPIHEFRIGP